MSFGFQEEHEVFRHSVAEFVAKEITPHAHQWEHDGEVPREIFKKLGDLGFWVCVCLKPPAAASSTSGTRLFCFRS